MSIMPPSPDGKSDPAHELHRQVYDLIVDHPMWIDGNGEPLEYLPEREARIGEFLDAFMALPIVTALLGTQERVRKVLTYTLTNDGEPLGTVVIADDVLAALCGDA